MARWLNKSKHIYSSSLYRYIVGAEIDEYIDLLKESGITSERMSLRRSLSLGRRAQAGSIRAKNELINSCLFLVISRAMCHWSLNKMDLIQWGNMGLLHAIKKYDPKHGTKFSTYALWWIDNYISRNARQSSLKISRKYSDWFGKYAAFSENFRMENGRLPTTTETAHEFNISEEHAESIVKYVAINHVSSLFLSSKSRHFIDKAVYSDPNFYMQRAEDIANVRDALSRMPEREATILQRRSNGDTLLAIATDMGLTRERIRQLETRAINLLANQFGKVKAKMSVADAMADCELP